MRLSAAYRRCLARVRESGRVVVTIVPSGRRQYSVAGMTDTLLRQFVDQGLIVGCGDGLYGDPQAYQISPRGEAAIDRPAPARRAGELERDVLLAVARRAQPVGDGLSIVRARARLQERRLLSRDGTSVTPAGVFWLRTVWGVGP